MPIQKDSISWTRPVDAGADDRGNPTTAPATGFPVDFLGNWQERERRVKDNQGGYTTVLEAVCITNAFMDGAVGDVATYGGREYVCREAVKRSRSTTSDPYFARYTLRRSSPGVTAS